MPQFVNVILKNSTASQHVYHATDDVLHQKVIDNQPLGAGETVNVKLVADENGHGQMTYGFSGGVDTSRTDLDDGDEVDA